VCGNFSGALNRNGAIATLNEPVQLTVRAEGETTPAVLDDNIDFAVHSARPVRTNEGSGAVKGRSAGLSALHVPDGFMPALILRGSPPGTSVTDGETSLRLRAGSRVSRGKQELRVRMGARVARVKENVAYLSENHRRRPVACHRELHVRCCCIRSSVGLVLTSQCPVRLADA
jgi:hypothetical protein